VVETLFLLNLTANSSFVLLPRELLFVIIQLL